MPEGVSRRALARDLGLSEGAVRKAEKAGRISPLADGTFDLETARRTWALRSDPARTRVRTTGTQVRTAVGVRTATSEGDGEGPNPEEVLHSRLLRARVESAERADRKAAEEEAARRGLYTETAAVRREMAKVATQVIRSIEGGLPEIASTLAGEFSLEQRDVLHVLRAAFRAVREKGAGQARAAAASVPVTVETRELVEA